MPKLSLPQWIILIAIFLFFGFVVFAVTRDYYLRHPLAPAPQAAAGGQQAATAGQARTWVSDAIRGVQTGTSIPEEVAGDDPVLLAQLGDERFEQRRFDEAIRLYERALVLDPDDVDTYNDLGLALHYLGQSERAIEVLDLGAQKGPDFQRIWLTLGFVKAKAGDPIGAQRALNEAREIEPDNDVGREAARLLGQLTGMP